MRLVDVGDDGEHRSLFVVAVVVVGLCHSFVDRLLVHSCNALCLRVLARYISRNSKLTIRYWIILLIFLIFKVSNISTFI